MKLKKKLFIVVGSQKYSLKNRMPLVEKLDKEFDITICIPFKNDFNKIFLNKYDLLFFHMGRNYLSVLFDLLGLLILYLKIKSKKPSHILNFSTKPVFLFSLINKIMLSKIILVNTFTGLGRFFYSNDNNYFYLIICKLCFSQKNIFIFQNKSNLEKIGKFLPKLSPIHLINGSGVKTKFFHYKQKKNNDLCFVGRLNEDKGIIELMRAFNLLDKKKYNSKLRIAGPIDFYKKKSHIEFNELLKLNNKIIYHGEIEDTKTFLSVNKFFILPSLHEGIPVTILEAMSCYTMFLVNKWDGCENIIKFNKKDIFISKLYDDYVKNIHMNLEKILELDQSKYKEIVIKYKKYFEKYFSISVIFNKYKLILDQ